jgi:D-alanyl-D-alanine carboxypeptidase/D-alanyl-D-alanine-endopeptidase (penicillin-binding protein 4)
MSFNKIFQKGMFCWTTLLTVNCVFSEDPCPLEHATVSIYAVSATTGEVLFDKNSDLSLIPASCMKIVTTAAALYLLETESRFETALEYDGYIDETKTLHGNLYIRGGGDPCLGSDRIPNSLSWDKAIAGWVEAVLSLGIQKIEGEVLGDATRWEKALASPSWSWEDLGNYYGAGASALSFHENYYSLFFKPGNAIGESTNILRTDPLLPTLILQNEVKTGHEGSGDRSCIYGCEFSAIQFIRGTIPTAVSEFIIKGALPDPAKCAADLLSKSLQEKGICIEHRNIEKQNKRITFHTLYSPTIKEIIHLTNQKSINLYAEHLLKKMGEVVYNEGSTTAGVRAVTNFWHSQNLDLGGFNMADGSGLSRKNLVTTKQLVGILLKMKKSEFFPIFFESLPQREGLMRAKSGTMSLIKGYTGYAGDIAFAILVNQCTNSKLMNEKIDLFLSNLLIAKKVGA